MQLGSALLGIRGMGRCLAARQRRDEARHRSVGMTIELAQIDCIDGSAGGAPHPQ
jgi:hypothetical protein